MNLRKLFLVPAFFLMSLAMAACTSEPSDELVLMHINRDLNWVLEEYMGLRMQQFFKTSGVPWNCFDFEITGLNVEGKSVSGKEAHVKWSIEYDCGSLGEGTAYQEYFYREYDKEGWQREDWPTFTGGD